MRTRRVVFALLFLGLLLQVFSCVVAFLIPLPPLSTLRAKIPDAHLLHINGKTIYTKAVGTGDAVVLIHGFAGSSHTWNKVTENLSHDHRVITLDLYGFGLSDRPKEQGYYTPEAQARLVLSVMDAHGISRAKIVGHSYGAHVAEEILRIAPQRATAVILVSGGLEADTHDVHWAIPIAYLFARQIITYPTLWESVFQKSFATIPSETLADEYRTRLHAEGLSASVEGFMSNRRLLAFTDNVFDVEPQVHPCILWGNEDTIIPSSRGEKLSQRSRGTLTIIPHVGHMVPEEKPYALAAVVRTCSR